MVVTKDQIQEFTAEASDLGFSLLGVTNIKARVKADKFMHWINEGYQADLTYLNRVDAIQKRLNPELLLPGCRSVIALGFPYDKVDHEKLSPSSTYGWISSYAIFEDYHLHFRKLGNTFIKILHEIFPGNHFFRMFSDSSPVLERGYATSAGLGWIGENSNVISQDFGSYMLLAEVFTDVVFDSFSLPKADRCGKCHRCIDLCPTQCILPNRSIDAGKCISYLTIEHKNAIPRDVRSKLGQWVFGCDICQTVCPWNQAKLVHRSSQKMIISPLVEISTQLSFSKLEFKTFYAHTPVLRATWNGFIRNMIVCAGNSRNPALEPVLTRHLQENPSPMIRSLAAWALGNLHSLSAQNTLSTQMQKEPDITVIAEIQLSLE